MLRPVCSIRRSAHGPLARWYKHRIAWSGQQNLERDNRGTRLEYGCHVRDVLRLTDYRLTLMLTADGPVFPSWNQDAAAISDRYGEQDPVAVAGALHEAAQMVAARLEELPGSAWPRTGTRDDGARFTVESFARYNIHDEVHHLYDVTGIRRS